MRTLNRVSLRICMAGAISLGISAYFGIRAVQLENGGPGGFSETIYALVWNVIGIVLVAGCFMMVSLLPGTRKPDRKDALSGLIFGGCVWQRG